VRSGDDIILFDRCGPNMDEPRENRPIDIHMLVNGELTEGTKVLRKQGGKSYEVSIYCFTGEIM
jgi:hypothetical protein